MDFPSQHDMIVAAQGSTFLWTEHYGEGRPNLVERLQGLAFAAAVALLASGTAEFLSMRAGW